MDKETLRRLESLNQLKLTDNEKTTLLEFFEKQDSEMEALNSINTDNVERMVHVMPMTNVIREDISKKLFTRNELQASAPESSDGYWQVPRLVE